MAKYGPFVHGLNKGGLDDIQDNQRLQATEGKFNCAVRALKGSFAELQKRLRWREGQTYRDKIFIEFTTHQEPARHPAEATWHMHEGAYLPIEITGIYYGSGCRRGVG